MKEEPLNISSSDFESSDDEDLSGRHADRKGSESSSAVQARKQDVESKGKVLLHVIVYLSMKDVVTKIFPLSKGVRSYFTAQNYRLFSMILKSLQLSRKNKRTDFVAKHDVVKLFKHCAQTAHEQ